jgi:hypothetical protein
MARFPMGSQITVANALSDEALVHRASRMSAYSGFDTETAALDAFEREVRRSAYEQRRPQAKAR